jgi:hypothetical protein
MFQVVGFDGSGFFAMPTVSAGCYSKYQQLLPWGFGLRLPMGGRRHPVVRIFFPGMTKCTDSPYSARFIVEGRWRRR